MSKDWYFGCSMTQGVHLPRSTKYWSQQVSDYFQHEHSNLGRAGNSNEIILNDVITNINKFESGDTVFIGITTIRLTFPVNYRGNLMNVGHPLIVVDGAGDFNVEQRTNLTDIVIHRLLPYENAHIQWYNNTFLQLQRVLEERNIKCFLWNPSSWSMFEEISKEDPHWSVKGHRDFAKYVVENLENRNYSLISKNLV